MYDKSIRKFLEDKNFVVIEDGAAYIKLDNQKPINKVFQDYLDDYDNAGSLEINGREFSIIEKSDGNVFIVMLVEYFEDEEDGELDLQDRNYVVLITDTWDKILIHMRAVASAAQDGTLISSNLSIVTKYEEDDNADDDDDDDDDADDKT
jgi:hypothetical protein